MRINLFEKLYEDDWKILFLHHYYIKWIESAKFDGNIIITRC